MRAAWYGRKGEARDVLEIGELPRPEPPAGHVRVRVAFSAVNPSDVKMRGAARGTEMPFPRVVPHQDGAGTIDAVGEGVPQGRVGERVWLYMAAWERWQGTAAEWTVVPARRAVHLPGGTELATGATLGIPAMTACRALNCDGGVKGATVLVHGCTGAVSRYAIQLARRLGATRVIATSRDWSQASVGLDAGADAVLDRGGDLCRQLGELLGPGGKVDRIVEPEFGRNLELDLDLLRHGGSIIAYGSDLERTPTFPFSKALQQDALMRFLLIYRTPADELDRIAGTITEALVDGALEPVIAECLPLDAIVSAHERQERGATRGRILLQL